MSRRSNLVLSLDDLSKEEVGIAGGKGANLGEMRKAGFPVPDGFVVTTEAFELFARGNDLEKKIGWLLAKIDANNPKKLETYTSMIRLIIESSRIPKAIVEEVLAAYDQVCKKAGKRVPVAVRSSATAEDSRDASFAGQQATFLNVSKKDEIIASVKRCWASTYTSRAIYYRLKKGFSMNLFTTAVVVQRQIASQKAGVGFSIHPTTGDRDSVVIESVLGQGEELVSGRVTPDTFTINKRTGMIRERRIAEKKRMKVTNKRGEGLAEVAIPRRLRQAQSLKSSELLELWSLARKLEAHYNHPQDFEWAVEDDGTLYLLQTRPVTVLGGKPGADEGTSETEAELKGLGASPGIGVGKARLVLNPNELAKIQKGEILVTKMTTPDYVPAMMKAAGIVTDEGGMTSHAAIVSRELGVPCVVGTGRATKALTRDTLLTVDGTKGLVFRGRVEAEIQGEGGDAEVPSPSAGAAAGQATTTMTTGTKVYMNLGVPEKVQDYLNLPFDGIGLMRIEFIIASYVGAHPLFLLESGVSSKFVDRLAEGMATVAGAVKPRPVVVRFSDFKTNEYRELKGGEIYEEQESNPMIGWRGVSRYISQDFSEAFRLELRAMRRVRDDMGLKNVWAMLPFVRTPWEVEKCLGMMEEEGLVRDESFKVWLMAEVPSMVFRAEEFARLCDGFSVGSNDLTQLILGIDRDSSRLGKMGYFDERDVAVKKAVKQLIEAAHASGITISICGQAPSVYPELAEYLVGEGIDSLSVNPDAVTKTKQIVFEAEEKKMKKVIAG
ncbi:MAG: phosphoenolpyruvate synthase [Thaumarchaeota archaeon]|nr:MAG: phosphoenolpyruvate synthase [Nitrososphaerota archaeon]